MPPLWLDVFIGFWFINLAVNPFIYAARYEVFRKSLGKMLKKESAVSAT